jgi:hypothetical protein
MASLMGLFLFIFHPKFPIDSAMCVKIIYGCTFHFFNTGVIGVELVQAWAGSQNQYFLVVLLWFIGVVIPVADWKINREK